MKCTQQIKAFTLVEMMVVLLLMALIAGGITLSLAGAGNNAKTTDIIGRIEKLDFQLRTFACQFNKPADLIINLDTGTLTQATMLDANNIRPLPAIVLPSHITIRRVAIKDQEIYSGEIAIHFSEMGITPSYALWLETDKAESHGLFFSGLTGQATRFENKKTTDNIFALLKDGGKTTP